MEELRCSRYTIRYFQRLFNRLLVMRKNGLVESLRTSASLSSYLEKHQLQVKLQAAIQQVVNDQPDDPMEALARIISQGSCFGERLEELRRLEELEELFQKHHMKLFEKLQPDGPVDSSSGSAARWAVPPGLALSRSEGGDSGQHLLVPPPPPHIPGSVRGGASQGAVQRQPCTPPLWYPVHDAPLTLWCLLAGMKFSITDGGTTTNNVRLDGGAGWPRVVVSYQVRLQLTLTLTLQPHRNR